MRTFRLGWLAGYARLGVAGATGRIRGLATSKRTSGHGETDELPQLRAPREKVRTELEDRMATGQALLDVPVRSEEELTQVRQQRSTWDEYNEELLKRRFTSQAFAKEYRGSAGVFVMGGGTPPLNKRVADFHDDVSAKLRRLSSVIERLPLCDEPAEVKADVSRRERVVAPRGDIFIVHGHEEAVKESVARLIARVSGREPTILHEQADRGQTIIEKFEQHARRASFAVALLTADDVGRSRDSEELQPRGRQNVVLELGYFMGALGRDRVAILYQEGVELPSDLLGVLYIAVDEGDGWRLKLAKALRDAGVDVDLNEL